MRALKIAKGLIRQFAKDQSGTTMVEFAIVISLFLLILFAVLDFSRLGYSWVMAEKSVQTAARIATVRFPVCQGVPQVNRRQNNNDTTYLPGASCDVETGLCASFKRSCTLDQAVGADSLLSVDGKRGIWTAIRQIVPSDVTKSNVLITYEFDDRLGFLGGPAVPMVTAELVGSVVIDETTGTVITKRPLYFEFVTPLSSLAGLVGAANASTVVPNDDECASPCIPYPNVAVSLPGEDLNHGAGG